MSVRRKTKLRLTFCAASLLMTTDAAFGQFREVFPDTPRQEVDAGSLVPTTERFVPPVRESVRSDSKLELQRQTPAATPSQPKIVKRSGVPELAIPGDAVPTPQAVPTPAAVVETKPNVQVVQEPAPVTTLASVRPAEPLSLFGASEDASATPLAFQSISPGSSTAAEVKALWGSPGKLLEVDGAEKLVYKLPGFRQIDLLTSGTSIEDDSLKIDSMVVHIEEPQDAAAVIEKLGLGEFSPVEIPDEFGQVLGLAVPERGVMLIYSGEPSEQKVASIGLEPINAELFRLRAEHDRNHLITQSLSDLDMAIQLDSSDAHAVWMKSELLADAGRVTEAMEFASQAVSMSPSTGLYRLTAARLTAEAGDITNAIHETRTVVDDTTTPAVVKARGQCQLGNLLAMSDTAEPADALKQHMASVETAMAEINNRKFAIRRMAKDILVDAHLSIAQDIAVGEFQKQQEVVPKWLIRATELAEDLIEEDRGDETLRMQIFRATLACYSVLDGNFDATVAAEESLNEGRRLIGEASDELYRTRVRRELIETLYYAAKIENARGRTDNALKYAQNGAALMAQHEVDASQFDRYVEGQLYFLMGSIHALAKSDHSGAVDWFRKAKTSFEAQEGNSVVPYSSFGEPMVSMGISFWEVGEKQTAIELTQKGTELMQEAVQEGALDLVALTIPYGNLATMHRDLGDNQQAKHFTEMMAKIETESKNVRR
ncbi:MAG: hypothetical protein R3C28_02030 [Pirellulaceae bacterium]